MLTTRASTLDPEPEGAPVEQQGTGLEKFQPVKATPKTRSPPGSKAHGPRSPSSGDNEYLDNLYNYEWELSKGSGGAWQWYAKGIEANIPDAHIAGKKHSPMMFTSDLALRFDPIYAEIGKRFQANPDQFADAFARAWFKLTHRDMGPIVRYLGPLVPKERFALAGSPSCRRSRTDRSS